jgi:carnitine O-octanoyltransferase
METQIIYFLNHIQRPGPTYETASTRGYYHGRTETMRTCTAEVVEWCKAMCDKKLSVSLFSRFN